jgi:hypothetical protein
MALFNLKYFTVAQKFLFATHSAAVSEAGFLWANMPEGLVSQIPTLQQTQQPFLVQSDLLYTQDYIRTVA